MGYNLDNDLLIIMMRADQMEGYTRSSLEDGHHHTALPRLTNVEMILLMNMTTMKITMTMMTMRMVRIMMRIMMMMVMMIMMMLMMTLVQNTSWSMFRIRLYPA